MPLPWPDDEIFGLVQSDLQPLFELYPDAVLAVPDGVFEEGQSGPLSNGSAHAVPWELAATATVRRQGEEVEPRTFTIRGVTIVQTAQDRPLFSRYVDWAGVWAQLGVSSGRGESDARSRTNRLNDAEARDQSFLDPSGADITDQLLVPPPEQT
jgi:hypothetical protein